jgi:hypothetical protein
MRKSLELNIAKIEEYYTITEDGRVWSKIKDRWLHPHDNIYGYIFYSISKGVDRPMSVFAHTLVALRYIGQPPSPKHEIDHIDDNKSNNHYINLQWVTHSQNILKAYANGRKHYWLGKSKESPSIITRMKMANAKKKRVRFLFDGMEAIFESIDDAAQSLNSYRRKIYRCIKDNTPFFDKHIPDFTGILSFVEEKQVVL